MRTVSAMKALVALGALCVGALSGLYGLGAMIGLSESHAGTFEMIRHAKIQAIVAGGIFLWAAFVLSTLRWRPSRFDLWAFMIAAASLSCLELMFDDSVIMAGIALASVPVIWLLSVVPVWSGWKNARSRTPRRRDAHGY